MWPFPSGYPEVTFDELREKYDYVIVGEWLARDYAGDIDLSGSCSGGGTAGCVLANRLSASPDKTVLLIERGPIADSWASRVPLLSSDFSSDGSRSQKRMSEYQPELGRPIELVHGSALGGSTRINQMLYTRGLRKEYDMWAKSGCEGWAWKDVEPFFKKSERFLEDGDDVGCHGKKGDVPVLVHGCPVLISAVRLSKANGPTELVHYSFLDSDSTSFLIT